MTDNFNLCPCITLSSASDEFCLLLHTFVNNVEPDQGGQNVGPDLDPTCFTL